MKTTVIKIPVTYPETLICKRIRVGKKWVRAVTVTKEKVKIPIADVIYFGRNQSGSNVVSYYKRTQWVMQGTAEVKNNGYTKIDSVNGIFYTKKGE